MPIKKFRVSKLTYLFRHLSATQLPQASVVWLSWVLQDVLTGWKAVYASVNLVLSSSYAVVTVSAPPALNASSVEFGSKTAFAALYKTSRQANSFKPFILLDVSFKDSLSLDILVVFRISVDEWLCVLVTTLLYPKNNASWGHSHFVILSLMRIRSKH